MPEPCKRCGGPITKRGGGHNVRFCSEACRQAAWRAKRRNAVKELRAALVVVTPDEDVPGLRRLTGARLRAERLRRDWTQGQLAWVIGRSQALVSRWEAGRVRIPEHVSLAWIARAARMGQEERERFGLAEVPRAARGPYRIMHLGGIPAEVAAHG